MSADYGAFLASKRRRVAETGRHVDPGEVHPSLFDWQNLIVRWAAHKGRAAVFADTGTGKTRIMIEWSRLVADRALVVAPLVVCQQTVREAARIGVGVRYVRDQSEAEGPGVWITNYERTDRFDFSTFPAVAIDESSRLKHRDSKTTIDLTEAVRDVPFRLASTATPAPNDVAELCTHAEWLGVMKRAEMLATYFVNDGKEWRLKGHAAGPMYRWMASWAVALRRPSDIGYSDDGHELPTLSVRAAMVDVDLPAEDGALFAGGVGGVSGRATVRKLTVAARVERAVELVAAEPDEPWVVWCGLNPEADGVAGALAERGFKVVNVEGSQAPEEKASAMEAFMDGQVQVLVTKPKIAGFGMNFQHCARMSFVGLSDSFEAYYQCIRRCLRYGQDREVVAYVVLSDAESAIADNVARKEREAERMTAQLVAAMRDTWLYEEAVTA